MNLKDYVEEQVEKENQISGTKKLRFFSPTSSEKIVKLYKTYTGSRAKMHPLNTKRVNEFLDQGFAFVGVEHEKELVGITVTRQFPENYPYFTLPANEKKGTIYTLGGLYVRPDFQGRGLATKLSKIAIQGTEKFAKETGKAVGIGYEVSYDNEKSLNTLSWQGNYIGYYNDAKGQEGLSVLLYRPFLDEPVQMERTTIKLPKNERIALKNLSEGLTYMGRQADVGGVTETKRELEDGNVVTTCVINRTVNTVTPPAFSFEK